MKALYTNRHIVTLEDASAALEEITRTRREDVADFTNLPNIFMRGRRVGRVPSSSADVIDGDKDMDFNMADDGLGTIYLYALVGTQWLRVQLQSF